MHDLSDYDFELPPELLAREPLADRTASRLLVFDRASGEIQHRTIRDLPELLFPGDLLILNDTRVIPARIFGHRAQTGGKWEGLFVGVTDEGLWRIIGQTRGKLLAGETLTLTPAHADRGSESVTLTLIQREEHEGIWQAECDSAEAPQTILDRIGTVPLPPYIGRKLADDNDWNRYQTEYARRPGAIAAPTAGLHFTAELLSECEARGVPHAFVTLHVGIGTFRPIAVERLDDHKMHSEWCELPKSTAHRIQVAKQRGGRVVAVGTTSVRTLESAAIQSDPSANWTGETDLFIRPPYQFRTVDCLLTNFHLPKSS
ncbi:MAG: tRNA preQ1(34) S-adenosylmethionine ribosyltransferase-isomerase QueA, partial [Planctomycetota bacterium]|nr:tRNA preQ1(34) S-adenosylmethionine ribosyltransferase-isomerase QueA [Planctomycetota bacterium]